MKKIIILLLVSLMVFGCFGCVKKKTEEEKFVNAIAKGIEARFKNEKMSISKDKISREDFLKQINAEYDNVKKFKETDFENKDLNKWKNQYLHTLESVSGMMEMYDTNQWYSHYDNGINYYRVEALYHINIIKKVPISDTYKKQFENMLILKTIDERFLDCLANGLETRWKISEDEEKDIFTKKDWEQFVAAEYDNIIKFKDEKFQNADLDTWGKAYIESIIQSKEALTYFDTDQWYAKYHSGIYHNRTYALYKINEIKPIPVSDERKDTLQTLLTDGEISEFTTFLINEVQFELESDEYGYQTYSAVVENTTSTHFSDFFLSVDLIDKDGVTVETVDAHCENWEPGEKARMEFFTEKDFVKLKNSSASWGY